MHPLLDDDDWMEEHGHLAARELADLLGIAKTQAGKALHRINPRVEPITPIESELIKNTYQQWGMVMLGLGLGRDRTSPYREARRLGIKKTDRSPVSKEDFWAFWRQYTYTHYKDLESIAYRIVVEPLEEHEDCDSCPRRPHCDWRTRLPCENYTLEDAIADATEHGAIKNTGSNRKNVEADADH